MPSTFFTEPPHWRWLIILYFFFGGLAGGCYFVASMLDLMGRPSDRPLARLGYLLAFPTVVVCGILLIADLGRPERFWHMMLQSATWRPMLKTYSPMSLGAWGLLVFGGFAFLSFLGALADSGRRRGFAFLSPPAPIGVIVSVLGGLAGFFLVSYTGVWAPACSSSGTTMPMPTTPSTRSAPHALSQTRASEPRDTTSAARVSSSSTRTIMSKRWSALRPPTRNTRREPSSSSSAIEVEALETRKTAPSNVVSDQIGRLVTASRTPV